MNKLYRNIRNQLIHATYDVAKWLSWPADEPLPQMVDRAKDQAAHYFVLKIVWEPEDISGVAGGCWMAYWPDFDEFTQGDSLPDAAEMAGDLLRLELEYRMSTGEYPVRPEHAGIRIYDGSGNLIS